MQKPRVDLKQEYEVTKYVRTDMNQPQEAAAKENVKLIQREGPD